jgi:hypothetical protein
MWHVGQYQGSSVMVWEISGVLISILFFYILWELCPPRTETSSLSSLQLTNQKLNIAFFLALNFTYPKKNPFSRRLIMLKLAHTHSFSASKALRGYRTTNYLPIQSTKPASSHIVGILPLTLFYNKVTRRCYNGS